MQRPILAASVCLALAALVVATAVRAESALRLAPPESVGEVAAATYDVEGRRIGDAYLAIDRRSDGTLQIEAQSGIDGAEHTVARAVLAPDGGGGSVQLLSQESRSVDALGQSIGILSIDHVKGEANCTTPSAAGLVSTRLPLPQPDRIANVPLNLLFLPLVRKEVSKVAFQILICRGGPRLLDAEARVADPMPSDGGHHIVEVRYQLELGPVLSHIIQPFVPRLSFWFDSDASGSWLAHRMPLYSKGPTVLVVRTGVSPGLFGLRP